MTHDKLMTHAILCVHGTFQAINAETEKICEHICKTDSIAEDWQNLLQSSCLMYQELANHAIIVRNLIDMLPAWAQNSLLAQELQGIEEGAMLIMRCATEGVNNVAAQLVREGIKE